MSWAEVGFLTRLFFSSSDLRISTPVFVLFSAADVQRFSLNHFNWSNGQTAHLSRTQGGSTSLT